MEMVVSSGDGFSKDDIASSVVSTYGIPDGKKDSYISILETVYDMIHNGGYCQTNGTPKDILSEMLAAEEVYCEIPFCLKTEDVVTNGIIDAVYRDVSGWHIIDYKTDAEMEDIDSVHSGQLETYASAFESLTGEKADARVYHIAV